MAQPSGTDGVAVGDSNPGITPSRLQSRMKIKSVTRNGVKRSLWWPMISSLWFWMNPCSPSTTCCRPPGFSTDSRVRTRAKNRSRRIATRISIATESRMGAAGCFGWMCSACSSASATPPKYLFRRTVKGSCSIENQYSVPGTQLHPSPQDTVQLITCFHQDRAHRQEQARKEPVQALPGNFEYSIGSEGYQKVAQQEAQHHALAGRPLARRDRAFGQGADHTLQPVEVHESDRTPDHEAGSHCKTESHQHSDRRHDSQRQHEAEDAGVSAGVEVIGRSGDRVIG